MPLEYDNNAFYYFAITAMSIYLLPGTWFALVEIYRAFLSSGENGTKSRTGAEKEKADKLLRETTGLARLKRPAFLINLVGDMTETPPQSYPNLYVPPNLFLFTTETLSPQRGYW